MYRLTLLPFVEEKSITDGFENHDVFKFFMVLLHPKPSVIIPV
jgi:hypothetical protein